MGQTGIPAWKRLGLKLKYAQEVPETSRDAKVTAETQAANISSKRSQSNTIEPPKKKRKTDSESKGTREHSPTTSKPSQNATEANGVSSERTQKKQVSFSADTKDASTTISGDLAHGESTAGKAQASAVDKKPKKKTAKKSQQLLVQKTNTALDYLTQYNTARPSWKFNKNRETWILKHIFSESDLPRDYDLALSRYIHGLKGAGARERLKSQCIELAAKENEGQKDTNAADASSTSGRSEEYAQRFKSEFANSSTSDSAHGNDEEDDPMYRSWIRAQPRSKIVLWAIDLDDGSPQLNGSDSKSKPGSEQTGDVDHSPQPRVKKRKNRTAIVVYDSSSSSSSSDSSETESESEESGGQAPNDHASEDETSSSGSDSESSADDGSHL
jgi:20S proteasome subunit alpha 1